MPKFKKRPVIIEAEQYLSKRNWLPKGICDDGNCPSQPEPHVHTIHDNQVVFVENGDWIIPEPNGVNYYPCKPDIFEKTYEPAV